MLETGVRGGAYYARGPGTARPAQAMRWRASRRRFAETTEAPT
jgi:hypothetical protein